MTVGAWAAQRSMRAGSLLVAILGDAVAPRRALAWLSELISLMRLFGALERLAVDAAAPP
jgi:DNA-binding transcriptional regulator PaaX